MMFQPIMLAVLAVGAMADLGPKPTPAPVDPALAKLELKFVLFFTSVSRSAIGPLDPLLAL